MTLSVKIRHRLGDFDLDASFESSGRLVALFGPSGSGKTSIVNVVAGLIRADGARIAVDGRVLVDTDTGRFVPPHRRRIGYVFQDARLFPHMSVRRNLGFGRFFAPRGRRPASPDRVIEMLGLSHLLERRPGNLSGGEKSRVAIGRALLAGPELILMDEPLASLDEARKREIIPYIARLRDEAAVPIVYVSHAAAEVAALATDVVLLRAGRAVLAGPPAEVLQRLDLMPQDEGGALLEMTVRSHDGAFGTTLLASPAGEIRVCGPPLPIGEKVRVQIRARDVMIATRRPEGLSALNVLAGRIDGFHNEGALVDVRLDCNGSAVVARLTRQSAHMLGLEAGQQVFAVVKTVSLGGASAAPHLM